MPLHVSSTMCSSSGGQNCIIQHLVSSQSVGGRPVRRLGEDCSPSKPIIYIRICSFLCHDSTAFVDLGLLYEFWITLRHSTLGRILLDELAARLSGL